LGTPDSDTVKLGNAGKRFGLDGGAFNLPLLTWGIPDPARKEHLDLPAIKSLSA
jgi:hypothetical protein